MGCAFFKLSSPSSLQVLLGLFICFVYLFWLFETGFLYVALAVLELTL